MTGPAEIDDEPPIKLHLPVIRDVIDRPARYARHPRHLSVVEMVVAERRLACARYDSPVRGLVVGENPGPNTRHDMPLYPWPPTSSAGRLMAMAALEPGEYLGCLYRRNLCDYDWAETQARARARAIVTALFDSSRDLRVVLCGAKVADAFDVRIRGDYFWRPIKLESRQTCVVIPHPSGVNRIYNQREAGLMTGAWMRWAALGEDHP